MTDCRGFSLIELAIVLIVVGLLTSSLLGPLAAQRTSGEETAARNQLDLTLDTLYGFAITHGRLPCPAAAGLDSSEASAGQENCSLAHGVIPWRSLGLPEVDPWGQRLTYYVHADFTKPPQGEARNGFMLTTSGNAHVKPATSSGVRSADALPGVIVSHGANGFGGYRSNGQRQAASHPDEAENADADLTFVDHPPDPGYDDLLAWIIPTLLNLRLVNAGRLP